ncbi:hypothetical protein [Nonomuraea dietziae]|uniref:hypothetical protein n=1 Tax=Nonomuraea dietziae TaxID=65515 RepID=UPI0031D66452
MQAHAVAVEAEHRLMHDLRGLRAATVHADPDGPTGADQHAVLSSTGRSGRHGRGRFGGVSR